MTMIKIESGQVLIRRAFRYQVFLFALLALAMPGTGLADCADLPLSCIRIVYGEVQTMPAGTVLLPLEVRFDDARGKSHLESLSDVTAGVAALPARVPSELPAGPLVYRTIPVNRTGEKWTILLSAASPRNFSVRVQARYVTKGGTTYLAAETNCFVFGRKLGAKAESKPEVLPSAWFSGLGLSIEPPFFYWPQTEESLRVTLHLGNRALPGTALTVFDGSFPAIRLLTDQTGRVIYAPPDDPALNRQGDKATKQIFLVAAHNEGKESFVVTRTLRLHRNRHTHKRRDAGRALFGAAALLACGAVIRARCGRRQA